MIPTLPKLASDSTNAKSMSAIASPEHFEEPRAIEFATVLKASVRGDRIGAGASWADAGSISSTQLGEPKDPLEESTSPLPELADEAFSLIQSGSAIPKEMQALAGLPGKTLPGGGENLPGEARATTKVGASTQPSSPPIMAIGSEMGFTGISREADGGGRGAFDQEAGDVAGSLPSLSGDKTGTAPLSLLIRSSTIQAPALATNHVRVTGAEVRKSSTLGLPEVYASQPLARGSRFAGNQAIAELSPPQLTSDHAIDGVQPSASTTSGFSSNNLPASPVGPQAGNSGIPIEAKAEVRLTQQLDATIEALTDLRDAARSAKPEMLVRHADFGAISIRIEASGPSDWRAVLTSRDSGFVPAIQAALGERLATSSGEAASHNGQHGNSRGGEQGGFSEPRYGSSLGSGQGSHQPYMSHHANNEREGADPESKDPGKTDREGPQIESRQEIREQRGLFA
ncbi:hypothetical protein Ga0102493_111251 [Erythrobacter litoralis]|uniref:hypothetical protein n=1 Tax=Erythrobacter litoralis TaxID=39960 RepID=UPI000863BA49|nr:hypothetical protein [Erythrobacter litoralis]AOL22279.1 hypothetical protein Ga0102493_111251 [Erythrobacter litoralis]